MSQRFPPDWKVEFEEAAMLGLGHLEWLFEEKPSLQNPAVSNAIEVQNRAEETGVLPVTSCLHFMIEEPFGGLDADTQFAQVAEAVKATRDIGGKLSVLPFLGLFDNRESLDRFFVWIRAFLQQHPEFAGVVACELTLTPDSAREIDDELHRMGTGITLDTGNLVRHDLNPTELVLALEKSLLSIHLKDVDSRGSSVPPGTGIVDFPTFLESLAGVVRALPVTLEIPRAENNNREHFLAVQQFRRLCQI